jgi:L-iditol 2-dehydrogenase
MTQRQATEMARIGGRVVLVGIPNHDEVSLHTSVMRRKGLTLTMVRRASHVYPRALALWARGLVDLPLLITHRLPLAETQRAFDLMADHADGVIRAAIEFDRA